MNKKNLLLIALLSIGFYVRSQQLPLSFFKWDTAGARFPVTHLHFNADSSLVQFAILSDRTGGMNPGVYENAVRNADILQPQFILSVGDLINGYSNDDSLVNKQWKDFNDIITPLSVPFFYVPGNHDISNAWMQKEWERRYGRSYYYFIYKNTLFLCLNSQDGGQYGMKEEQVNYFLSLLQKYPAVKWTFLFMHQPLWAGKNATGFEKIEAALQDRNYTVFAGHTHNYLLSRRNNRKYFILATTGGGTGNRGEKFGEFNHITWVTVKDREPKIVNIKLDGLVREDIVDEKIKKATRSITAGSWLRVNPVITGSGNDQTVSPTLTFKNNGEYPLRVSGKMPAGNDFKIEPGIIDLSIPPGTDTTIGYTLSGPAGRSLNLAGLAPVGIELQAEHLIDGVSYALPAKKRLLIDWPRQSVKLNKAPGGFDPTDTTGYIRMDYPEYISEAWDWHGPEDCAIQFKVLHDDKALYLNAVIRDDHFIFQPTDNRDKIFVYLEDLLGNPVRITILPEKSQSAVLVTDLHGKPLPMKIGCKTKVAGNQLQLFLKVSLQDVLKKDGTIRFNMGYADQDDIKSLECATLYWKPVWQTEEDYRNSGTYTIRNE